MSDVSVTYLAVVGGATLLGVAGVYVAVTSEDVSLTPGQERALEHLGENTPDGRRAFVGLLGCGLVFASVPVHLLVLYACWLI
jgi:hypothetical protein